MHCCSHTAVTCSCDWNWVPFCSSSQNFWHRESACTSLWSPNLNRAEYTMFIAAAEINFTRRMKTSFFRKEWWQRTRARPIARRRTVTVSWRLLPKIDDSRSRQPSYAVQRHCVILFIARRHVHEFHRMLKYATRIEKSASVEEGKHNNIRARGAQRRRWPGSHAWRRQFFVTRANWYKVSRPCGRSVRTSPLYCLFILTWRWAVRSFLHNDLEVRDHTFVSFRKA